ncbi:MAG TPA: GNAT family N-acetyltransferase [Parvibaculum sp.]|uniref:GNAT family N-acetyltransferase n=1 Tax=Parvibaculum sp. TaxID=2024848 RepID=UPI002CCBD9D6|nr:GNAT family N-acetyltransferase [Parvibaculum sp.]HMM13531.1 GNAT family N-acetyltransferase [Parvibaculum sp.]
MKPLTNKNDAEKQSFAPINHWPQRHGEAGRVIHGPWSRKPEVLLTVHDSFEGLRSIWTALEVVADCTVFQTHAWLSAWFRHVGARQGIEPAIVVGWDGEGEAEGPLFIFPFGLKRGFSGTRLVWLGAEFCDYQAPILAKRFSRTVHRSQFKSLWAEVRAALPHHDIVELDRLPEFVGEQLNPLLALGNATRHASSAHMTRLKPVWSAYYDEKRSSGSKKRDRQKRRKLEEFGEVALVTPQSPAEIARSIDELIAQKSAAFARMGVANPFARPGVREFYLELATDPAAKGLIHVSHLDVGGRIAATNWGVSFRGRYHYVLASYAAAEEFARFGPGMVQLMELMRHATETGHGEFDFTIGDEPYKADWCEVETRLFDHLEAVTMRGWLALMPAVLRRRAKRFIKQTPVLWEAFTRLRAVAGSLPGAGMARV